MDGIRRAAGDRAQHMQAPGPGPLAPGSPWRLAAPGTWQPLAPGSPWHLAAPGTWQPLAPGSRPQAGHTPQGYGRAGPGNTLTPLRTQKIKKALDSIRKT